MVRTPELVVAPVDPLPVREEPVPLRREDVVDHDLGARAGQAREHPARVRVRPRAEPVDDHPYLDALRELALQQSGHRHPDLALAPAEH